MKNEEASQVSRLEEEIRALKQKLAARAPSSTTDPDRRLGGSGGRTGLQGGVSMVGDSSVEEEEGGGHEDR